MNDETADRNSTAPPTTGALDGAPPGTTPASPDQATQTGGFDPIAPRERLGALDLLRGIALLGILMVNMPLMALPMVVGFGDASLADGPASDIVAWTIVTIGFQFSFISLFSLLFGAGFAMMAKRAAARGQSIVGPYLRRAALLLMFGLLHVVLLWMGDILFLYGLLAFPLLLLKFVRPRLLLAIGACVVLFGIVATAGTQAVSMFFMGLAEQQRVERAERVDASPSLPFDPDADPDVVEDLEQDGGAAAIKTPPRGLQAMVDSQFNVADPIWIDAETAAHVEGPFTRAMAFRLVLWGFGLMGAFFTFGWIVFGFFLVGAGLMKLDFFAQEASEGVRRWQRRLLWALPLGLAVKAGYVAILAKETWSQSALIGAAMGLHVIGGALLTIGLVALGCLVGRSASAALPVRLVGNAGRMALTLYLMQSVVAVAIMDHWGLARFGSFDRMSLVGLTVAIWIAQVIFANLWFLIFRMGPLEWVWRLGTYLKPARLLR